MRRLISGLDGTSIWRLYIERTRGLVQSWPLRPRVITDRVAVTIFQPARQLEAFAYAIRANMHRLGPRWALQVFYCQEQDRTLLGRAIGAPPANVTWSPIHLNGRRCASTGRTEANLFRMSLDFWGAIPAMYEHVFIFEADGLVIRGGGCVDRYVGYDYVGAPWPIDSYMQRTCPSGGNGGMTLRRRSSNIRALGTPACADARARQHFVSEDLVMCQCVQQLEGVRLPPRNLSLDFAAEIEPSTSPCALHQYPGYHPAAEVWRMLCAAGVD